MRALLAIVAMTLLGCAADARPIPEVSVMHTPELPALPAGAFAALERYPEEIEVALAELGATGRDAAELYAVVGNVGDLCMGTLALQGCFLWASNVIVIDDEWQHEDRLTVVHEVLHWASDQQTHDDPAVWGRDGALGRAYERLGLR